MKNNSRFILHPSSFILSSFVLLTITAAATAWGASIEKGPHIGFLYPAGGRQGSVVEVTVGGQFLKGVETVYVSGEGVHAKVLQYGKALNNKEIGELRKQLNELLKQRRAAETGKGVGALVAQGKELVQSMVDPLPDHPLLRKIDKMSLAELEYWVKLYFNSGKRQPNAQIGETAVLEIAIEPGAEPGDRELRLAPPAGLTNPMCFQVGLLPEIAEQEPNDQVGPVFQPDRSGSKTGPTAPAIELPATLNGQIMPGDVDRFRIHAKKGQQLVIRTQARHLIPYLADAVPGWFQATLALYDAQGKEIAFDDDYRFDPDPVLACQVPEDGEYQLEVRDSIYRGREDFVYRVTVGELPFITRMDPMGGRIGHKARAKIFGWNLPEAKLPLDTAPGPGDIRQVELREDQYLSNAVPYAVDTLKECREHEKNDVIKHAQHIALPRIVNGCIGQPGDIDIFRIAGRKDEEIVAEVDARRLNSPMDSMLRLTDAEGHVLAWNDDREPKESGLQTHEADSYLRFRLPADGSYYVEVADSQRQGGEDYGYRLRLGPPRPDFALRATPSRINVPAGRTVPVCVHVLRKDGFDGAIEIALKDAPAGVVLKGARIPAGRDRVRMTLTAPAKPLDAPINLQLEGRARVGEDDVVRPVEPAEDMMQAFAYRHLVPAHQLLLAVGKSKGRPVPAEVLGDGPVRIPEGGSAQVNIKTPKNPKLADVILELDDPPKGLTLEGLTATSDGLAFTLKAEGETLKAGYTDNLIVDAYFEADNLNAKGKNAPAKIRVSLGALPAIPFEIAPR